MELEDGADGCVLRFSRRELRLPARVFAAVEFATAREVFAVRDAYGVSVGELKALYLRGDAAGWEAFDANTR